MYFLPSSVLTTGTFCHFLTKCLPAVPSSGGIPSRPAFVPGGQLSADRPFSIGNVPPPAHCSQQQFFFMSPTGDFLSIAKESHQRTPAETNGFCTSFAVCKSCILNPAEAGNRLEGAYCSIVGVRTPEILSSPEPGAAAGLLLSQFPLRPITNKALEGKENPKTIGFKRKSPNRRLWRMKRGGFEEVSRFPCHNVAGNRLTRR